MAALAQRYSVLKTCAQALTHIEQFPQAWTCVQVIFGSAKQQLSSVEGVAKLLAWFLLGQQNPPLAQEVQLLIVSLAIYWTLLAKASLPRLHHQLSAM